MVNPEIEKWYKERIVGRIQKNRLSGKGGVYSWNELNEEIQLEILTFISGKPEVLLVFYKNKNLWTVVTSTFIFSFVNGHITEVKLTDIKGNFTIFNKSSMSQKELKTMADTLIFPELNKKIWVPSGEVMFGFMNTLLYVTKKYTKRPTGA